MEVWGPALDPKCKYKLNREDQWVIFAWVWSWGVIALTQCICPPESNGITIMPKKGSECKMKIWFLKMKGKLGLLAPTKYVKHWLDKRWGLLWEEMIDSSWRKLYTLVIFEICGLWYSRNNMIQEANHQISNEIHINQSRESIHSYFPEMCKPNTTD